METKKNALFGTGIALILLSPLTILFSRAWFPGLYLSTFSNMVDYDAVSAHVFSAAVVLVWIVIGLLLVKGAKKIV